VYQSDGTQVSNPHTVIGRVTSTGTSVTVTLTGSAAFTSSTSYQCVASNNHTGSFTVTYVSGSQFTIGAIGWSDTMAYICTGN
jgi:hypothetical protein